MEVPQKRNPGRVEARRYAYGYTVRGK